MAQVLSEAAAGASRADRHFDQSAESDLVGDAQGVGDDGGVGFTAPIVGKKLASAR